MWYLSLRVVLGLLRPVYQVFLMAHVFGVISKSSLSPGLTRFFLLLSRCFNSFTFYVQICYSFRVNLCEGYIVCVKIFFFDMRLYSYSSTIFWRIYFSQCIAFASLSLMSWLYLCYSISGPCVSLLICVFYCPSYITLTVVPL